MWLLTFYLNFLLFLCEPVESFLFIPLVVYRIVKIVNKVYLHQRFALTFEKFTESDRFFARLCQFISLSQLLCSSILAFCALKHFWTAKAVTDVTVLWVHTWIHRISIRQWQFIWLQIVWLCRRVGKSSSDFIGIHRARNNVSCFWMLLCDVSFGHFSMVSFNDFLQLTHVVVI